MRMLRLKQKQTNKKTIAPIWFKQGRQKKLIIECDKKQKWDTCLVQSVGHATPSL